MMNDLNSRSNRPASAHLQRPPRGPSNKRDGPHETYVTKLEQQSAAAFLSHPTERLATTAT